MTTIQARGLKDDERSRRGGARILRHRETPETTTVVRAQDGPEYDAARDAFKAAFVSATNADAETMRLFAKELKAGASVRAEQAAAHTELDARRTAFGEAVADVVMTMRRQAMLAASA